MTLNPARVGAAILLVILPSLPAAAAPKSREERATLRDSARAAEVLGERLARARAAASRVATNRRVADALLKAELAMESGSHVSALTFLQRAEALLAQAGGQK